ncbi:hypothetical protein [Enterococcus faecalis]|uniref:Uncharacterized protein n=1 Tax=Enterococcus faecalis RP2S-4 TaxID=1244145 RepID=A0ABC9TLC7_ENTFL|nr:hypothetical protein [Enterococcus faecalis]EPI08733.1 hypothetical protein D358_01508 [Enterococcus faecalis RP2S-4]
MTDKGYIFSKYRYIDQNENILEYDEEIMNLLCSKEYEEYFVSPFQKIEYQDGLIEYIFTTYTKGKGIVQTCGINLTQELENSLIEIKLVEE